MNIKNPERLSPNDFSDDLITVRGEIIESMQKLSQEKNKLQQATELLSHILNLEQRHELLLSESTGLIQRARLFLEVDSMVNNKKPEILPNNLHNSTQAEKLFAKYGRKRAARIFRDAYVTREAQSGKKLVPKGTQYFIDGGGLRVAITFSSEQKLGKRWWVNWKKETDRVVILGRIANNNVAKVMCLSQRFLHQYANNLKPEEDGMIQITTIEREKHFYARVPQKGEVEITDGIEPDLIVSHDPFLGIK